MSLLGISCAAIVAACSGESDVSSTAPEPETTTTSRGHWWDDRVIDIHGHLGAFEGYDISLETLLANVERYGVRKVLVSNIDGAELEETANVGETEANRRALEVLRQHPGRLVGIAWTRPEDGAAEKVEPFLGETLDGGKRAFVALKFHPEMNHFPADDPRVDPYLELCGKHGLPAVFHSDKPGTNADPERIYAAARRHPEVPVVLYHMGFLGPHEPAVAAAERALEAGDAELYLGTAQADPHAVLDAVRRLGAERVLFGTDAAYYGREHYEKYEPMIDLLRRELTAEELALILHGNAERLFGVSID